MYVKDRAPRIWTPYDHGKITLATFNERGRVCEKVQSENYATDLLVNQFKWWARKYISARVGITSPVGGVSNLGSYDEWSSPWSGAGPSYQPGVQGDNYPSASAGTIQGQWPPAEVLLTSAAHAEDPTNDRYIRGNLVAWSDPTTYAGTDTKRGSLNPTECLVTPTKAVFVFDWATNAGNGTIQSVYWSYCAFSNSYSYHLDMFMQSATVPSYGWGSASPSFWVGGFPTGFTAYTSGHDLGLWLDPDGVSYWTCTPNSATGDFHMVKRTLLTGAYVSNVRLNGSSTIIMGFANDGTGTVGNWWTYDAAGNLKKWPAAGGTATSTTSRTTLGIGGPPTGTAWAAIPMFFYNGYVWLASDNAPPFHMYQVQVTGTPTLAATLTIPQQNAGGSAAVTSGIQGGMYYVDATNGDELWLTASSAVQRFDLSGNFRGAFIVAGNFPPTGMQSWPGGGYIYHCGFYSGGTYVNNMYVVNNSRQFHTRSLLPSAVSKANTQTMKLTYEFDYT